MVISNIVIIFAENNYNMSLLQDMPMFGNNANPISQSSVGSNTGMGYFLNYLNILEGVKTRVKNVHWAAKRLPNSDKLGAHRLLDDLLSLVSDFQDLVAEQSMGHYGPIEMNSVQGVSFQASTPKELLEYIYGATSSFYDSIPQNDCFIGIKSECEVFIGEIKKLFYLFNLTE